MIGQIPAWRHKNPPKHKFEPFKSGMGIEGDNNGPSGPITATKDDKKKAAATKAKKDAVKKAKKSSLAQVEAGPEKVHELLPLEFQERANTNTPNLRTTFYGQKE